MPSIEWRQWLHAWTEVGLLPLSCAFFVWGPTGVLAVALTGGLVVGGLFLLEARERIPAGTGGSRWPVGSAARVALAAGVLFVTCGVLVRLSLVACLVVLAAMAATSPPALLRVRGLRRRWTTASPASAGDQAVGVDPPPSTSSWLDTLRAPPAPGMSDAELCRAWRRSFVALQSARTAPARERVVVVRQGYLDEMETRAPGPFSAWLASGARAASGPERFLLHPGQGPGAAPTM